MTDGFYKRATLHVLLSPGRGGGVGKCGLNTHHRRRSNPNIGINFACLQGVSPFDFDDVAVIDGVNHPSDARGRCEIVGRLRFVCTAPHSRRSAAHR